MLKILSIFLVRSSKKIMSPSRRLRANPPVDKYFPSDSLVIGKSIQFFPFCLPFRPFCNFNTRLEHLLTEK